MNISDQTNEIYDAIGSIEEQIQKINQSTDEIRSDVDSVLTPKTESNPQIERIAHLRLAKKFLMNILTQLHTFEESPLELRINQLKAISKLITYLSDTSADQILGYFRQPTGAGKTVLFGIIAQLLNVKTLVLVPRTNLVTQTQKEFTDVVGIQTANIGTVMQGINDTTQQFTIATYQSHIAKMKRDAQYQQMVAACELIICDEAHRAIGDQTFSSIKDAASGNSEEDASSGEFDNELTAEEELAEEEIFKAIGTINKTAAVFAFTATPELAGKSVDTYFKNCIASEKYSDMVAAGICVPFLLHRVDGSVSEVDLEGTFTEELEANLLHREGTYTKLASEYAMALNSYKKTQNNTECPLRGVAFCVNIAECDTFARVATEYGLRCRVITGREAKGKEGQTVVTEAEQALVAGEIDLIVTVKKLAEGWDCKPVNAAIWARACTSAADVVQGIGRTGRAYYDDNFGKKTGSHIFETRWELRTRNGKSRYKRPLGIADALIRNGEDPTLICSNSDKSALEVEKPPVLPIVKDIFKQCVENEDFAKVFASINGILRSIDPNRKQTRYEQYLAGMQSGRRTKNPLYEHVQDKARWGEVSSFETIILQHKYKFSAKELQKIKVQLFDLLGEEILKRGINDELCSAIIYCGPFVSNKAFVQLTGQNPSVQNLCSLACSSQEYYRDSWYLLVKKQPLAKYFILIMEQNPYLRKLAWEELKKRAMITKEVTKRILKSRNIRQNNEQVYLEAQRYLLDQTIENEDMAMIIETTTSPELGLEAARMLLEQNPNSERLYTILQHQASLKAEVLELLIEKGTPKYLVMIIKEHAKPWQLAAARKLLRQQATNEELLVILQYIPAMEDEVGGILMTRKLSSEILVEIILTSAKYREQAVELLFSRTTFSTIVRPKIEEIIQRFPTIAPQAARALLDNPIQRNKRALQCIIIHVESAREEAAIALRQHNLDSESAEILKKYTPHLMR